MVVLLLGAAGNMLGSWMLSGKAQIGPRRLALVIGNLYCLYVAVGGAAWFVSALSDRRGRAVGVIFAFVLGSFLLDFLARFWSLAEQIAFLSLLHYYQPLLVLRDGTWLLHEMSVLLAFAAATWTAGGFIFARRDLSTL